MAAPTLQARSGSGHVPAGIKLDNGYSSVMRGSPCPTLEAWVITVKPPGVQGGEPIKTTTMENVLWHTMAPSALLMLSPAVMKCAYDPAVYSSALSAINSRGSFTHHWPDGSTLTFFGFIQHVEFGELAENQQPTVDITVIPTNYDPANHVEASPVYVNVAGT